MNPTVPMLAAITAPPRPPARGVGAVHLVRAALVLLMLALVPAGAALSEHLHPATAPSVATGAVRVGH